MIVKKKSEELQGLLKFSLINNEMIFLDNIEVAPHNYGSQGRYDLVIGSLLAYCSKQSMILGKNNYEGFVVFESKTNLIDFYKNKYGATYIGVNRMYISDESGQKLIEKYLYSITSEK